MTEDKWLKFAGFLNSCIYKLNHEDCPFMKFRNMDQYQRLEMMLTIAEHEAEEMMSKCVLKHEECKPIIFKEQETGWGMAVAN